MDDTEKSIQERKWLDCFKMFSIIETVVQNILELKMSNALTHGGRCTTTDADQ